MLMFVININSILDIDELIVVFYGYSGFLH